MLKNKVKLRSEENCWVDVNWWNKNYWKYCHTASTQVVHWDGVTPRTAAAAAVKNVQLRRGFIKAESPWPPRRDLGVSVNEDALQFQLTVQQQNAVIVIVTVSNQQVTFAVQWQVIRILDVSEWSQYCASHVHFTHLCTHAVDGDEHVHR